MTRLISSLRFIAISVLLIALLGGLVVSGAAHAAERSPNESAELFRKALFGAQNALVATDNAEAALQLKTAQALYVESFSDRVKAVAPELDSEIMAGLTAASDAIMGNNSPAFAAERARIWTRLLGGTAQITFKALEANDLTTAQRWFKVREYRSSTKFSLPGASGILALDALSNGKLSAAEALKTVRTDLYDTYQARLNQALADADAAVQKGYAVKVADMAGASTGYFEIIGSAYSEQRGLDALKAGRATFDGLVAAALAGNTSASAYQPARLKVTETLKGFRAAPLSQAELERRAGQLLRYVSLVDVEYGRGVRDGKVVKDLEIQEATTFREGAIAAFTDLESALAQRDPARTEKVSGLLSQLKGDIDRVVDPKVIEDKVALIGDELAQLLPAEWTKNATNGDFDVIYSVLDQIEPAVKQEQWQLAENARIEAYAILDSGIEKKLRGFTPDLAFRIETAFWVGEQDKPGLSVLLANRAPVSEIKSAIGRVRESLKEGQVVMASFRSAPGAVVGNAAVIVFREGLEAVLILASLIASLRTPQLKKYRRPIAIGALLAFVASLLTWVVANSILTALSRYGEKLEAIVGIIAIGVLLLITNWFFHKTYWTGWMAGFHQRKNELIGGSISFGTFTALIFLGFTSIYREGFETVLFLQSLVLEAGILIVVEGVVIGLIATFGVGVVTFALQTRLPYKKMLIVTGIFIGVVLIAMVGKTVFAMQAVGWMPITPIGGVWFPYWLGQWFGLYATWQGILLQIASAAFVIGSYFLAERQNKTKRTAKTSGQASGEPRASAM